MVCTFMEKESFEAYDKNEENLWFKNSWKYTSEIYLIWTQKGIAGLDEGPAYIRFSQTDYWWVVTEACTY